ncbi:MAG: hypothetical protein ABJ018_08855 [Paracoccaceae bacterium]
MMRSIASEYASSAVPIFSSDACDEGGACGVGWQEPICICEKPIDGSGGAAYCPAYARL